MLIGSREFLGQALNLFLQLVDGLVPGVIIHCGLVCYIGGFSRISQSRDVLVEEMVVGAYAGNHQAVAVASDRLLQNRSQL